MRFASRLSGLLLAAATTALPLSALAQEPATDEGATEAEPTLAKAPELKELVAAEIPAGTRFPAPEVEVLLEIEVGADGAVAEVTLSQGAGEPFDAAALAAARRFEFEPAELTTGEKVPVSVSFRMRIQRPPPPPPPPVRFAGRLLERGTRRPLIGVEIVARTPEKLLGRTVTDEAGGFRLELAAPRFSLVAAPGGHARLEAPVVAEPGEERDETFYLEQRSSGFETVVRAEPVRREVTRQVISKEVVETLAGTQGDTLKVVQNLPGVARSSFGGGQLILRGASPEDSRTFLEGQEIPSLFHFGGLRSSFNSAFLESVEFYPGNFSADFGRATGGVVDVKIRDPARDTFRGQLDLNLYDAGGHLEGPVSENWSVGAAFHRSYIDTLLPLVLPEETPLSFNTAPRYYDYQFLATWQPDSKRRLRFIYYGSMDKLSLLFDRPASDPVIRGELSARIMFHSLQAAYRSEPLAGLTQETSIQVGTQGFETQIGPSYFFNLDVRRFSVRSAWSGEPYPWLALRGGIDLRLDEATIALNSPQQPKEGETGVPSSSSTPVAAAKSSTLYAPALFLEARLTPVDRLLVLPSLRLDWYGDLRKWGLDPRLALRWKALDQTTLVGGIGLYQQTTAPDESDPDSGNPDLFPERSLHTSLGVEQRLGDGLELTATGFHKALDRLVVRNPARAIDATQPPYTSDGSGRIYGLELQLKARLGEEFQGWIAYTFQRSFRTDGPGLEERAFDFDQPHILTAVGTYTIGGGWSAGARFRLVSGSPTTPVVGAVYDSVNDTWAARYGPINSARLETFHQLDVRVDKGWTFDTWKLGVYLDVQNVYNRGNPEGVSYNFDYTRNQPVTGLPILPIVGAKGEW